MRRNTLETLMGAVVLVVAIFFVSIAYKSGKITDESGYRLKARFERVDGIARGSDVKLGGIKIGTVLDQSLDPQTYSAILTMSIRDNIKLPADSSAEIASDGLLGNKYVSLTPGGEDKMLANNEEIKFTQSSVNFEKLLGKFMFEGKDKKPEEKESK